MKPTFFDTDMAVDCLEEGKGKDFSAIKNLSYGIKEITVNVKNLELERKLGKNMGLYVTYDSGDSDKKANEYLSGKIANALKNMLGVLPQSPTILVVGLGNSSVLADALGNKTIDKVLSNRLNPEIGGSKKTRLCAISTGVAGKTGIESSEIVSAVVDRVKPCAVIVVDALSTSAVRRLGNSYQLTTAGISPGSGVYRARPAIDKKSLGIPVVAIGVPLVLSMRSLIYDFVGEYVSGTVDEFNMRRIVEEKGLSRLVVAPKDVTALVETSSTVIANAINAAFLK